MWQRSTVSILCLLSRLSVCLILVKETAIVIRKMMQVWEPILLKKMAAQIVTLRLAVGSSQEDQYIVAPAADGTRDAAEDEKQLSWVKDWISSSHLEIVEITGILAHFPDISVLKYTWHFMAHFSGTYRRDYG